MNPEAKVSMQAKPIEIPKLSNHHSFLFLLVEPVTTTTRYIALAPKMNASLKSSLMLRWTKAPPNDSKTPDPVKTKNQELVVRS